MYGQNYNNYLKVRNENYYGLRGYWFNNNISSNLLNIPKSSEPRKMIYEKIDYRKKGDQINYIRGTPHIRYVGSGNNYNIFNREIIRNPGLLKPGGGFNCNFTPKNMFLGNGRIHREGPRFLIQEKMIN